MTRDEAIRVWIVVTVTFVEAACLVLYVDWLGGYGSAATWKPSPLPESLPLIVLTAAVALAGFLQVWATRTGVATQRAIVTQAARTRHDQWRAELLAPAFSSISRIATYAFPLLPETGQSTAVVMEQADGMRRLVADMEDKVAAATIVASQELAEPLSQVMAMASAYAVTWMSAAAGKSVDFKKEGDDLCDTVETLRVLIRSSLQTEAA